MTSASTNNEARPDHVITINYGGDQPGPSPETLTLFKSSESFAFVGGELPPDAEMQVSFDYPQHFSVAIFREGGAPVTVSKDLPRGKGTYRCQLISANGELMEEVDIPGGAVEVDRPSDTR